MDVWYQFPVEEWFLSLEIDTATRVLILDEANCSSGGANTFGKSMNEMIFRPALG